MIEKLVFTNGCFDVVHSGHVQYLREAKKLGRLIIGVNTDEYIRKTKREPVNNLKSRVDMLTEFGFADDVIVFEEDTPIDLIRRIKPDIYVRGGDDSLERIDPEIRSYFGDDRIIIIPIKYETSSTKIICRIKDE